MGSYDYGKKDVCNWIHDHYNAESTVLDVGACDGKWRNLLPEYTMDAIEIFKPYADRLTGYRRIYNVDIAEFHYKWYDLIIFGDVIEHMPVDRAQKVLAYAKDRCNDMIVAVPFQYRQGTVDGNVWQAHLQDDLTPELFAERYPGFAVLVDPGNGYCYYHKKP